MHRRFADKKRRHLNLHHSQVKNVLPEYFAEAYPKFITLLEKYYEWQDENNATELLNHLFANRDINETDITLLTYIEDELLLGDAYFKGFGDTDAELRAAANFSNTLFRSKGTKFAIEWFFRSFYGLDVEVIYTKENIFKIGEPSSTVGYESLKYLTDDKLYQTWALLVKSGVAISKWNDIFKLFVHPAGMYLGGEVFVTSAIQEAIRLMDEDEVVTPRNTTSYTITPFQSSRTEGTSFEINVDATNLSNNVGQGSFYLENITSSNNDFVSFVDSSEPELIYFNPLTSNTARATFYIPIASDTDETESNESFRVVVLDDENQSVGNVVLTINDKIIGYTLTVNGQENSITVDEGETINFTVTAGDLTIPDSTLFYYINTGTTSLSDYVVNPPTILSQAPVSIIDGVGSFSIQTKVDTVVDDGETFTVVLATSTGVVKDNFVVTLNDVVPAFSVSVSNVTEGNSLVANLTADLSSVGETVNWTMTGSAAADSRVAVTSGSFVITGTSGSYILTGTSSSSLYQGNVSGTISMTETAAGFTTSDTFNLVDKAVTYLISSSPEPATEGDTITFSITGTNIDNAIDHHFYVSHVTTDDADFSTTPPSSGSRTAVSITNNASSPNPTLTIATNTDVTTEEFDFVLTDASTGGNIVATERVSILPAGATVTYTLTPDLTTVTESSVLTVNFLTNDTAGYYYYWVEGTNITSDDFTSGYATNSSRQQILVEANSPTEAEANIILNLKADKIREGTETFVVKIAKTNTGGAISNSGTITITDSSVQTYTISASDVVEGSLLSVTVTPNIREVEDLYFEITGSGVVGRFNETQISKGFTSLYSSYSQGFFTSISDDYEGPQTGTVTVSIDDYASNGGTIVGSDTFQMTDRPPSGLTLVTDLVSDTADEGDVINFTFDGNNLPPKTYYAWPDVVYPKQTTSSSPIGSFFIYCDTTNLEVGMTAAQSLSVGGSITFISSGVGVDMSEALSSGVSAGEIISFAQPEVWSDFTGSPYKVFTLSTGSPEQGTFSVTTNTDDDFENDTYTFGVYDTPTGTLLKSRTITINDTTPTVPVVISDKPSLIRTRAAFPIVQAGVIFKTDGQIVATAATTQTYDNIVGTWLSDVSGLPANRANYEVRAVSNFTLGTGTAIGSFGTWLSMNTENGWTAQVEDPQAQYQFNVTISIREVSAPGVPVVPSNSDSWTVTIRAEEIYSDGTATRLPEDILEPGG